jgi:hypothetical protein
MPKEKTKQAQEKTAVAFMRFWGGLFSVIPEVSEAGKRAKRKIRKKSLDLP